MDTMAMRFLFTFMSVIAMLATGCSGDASTTATPTGMLQTRDYIVTLYTGDNGSRYTVQNSDGETIESDLTLETMIAMFPQLEFIQTEPENIIWAGLGEL